MKRRNWMTIVPILFVFVMLYAYQSKAPVKPYSIDFFSMNTVMNITAYTPQSQKAVDDARKNIDNLDAKLSRTLKDSEIYKLNAANGAPTQVSEETYQIIAAARRMAEETAGAFDPTVACLTDLWQIGTEQEHIPSAQEIKQALESVGYQNIELLDENKVALKNGAKLDLGGVGKGYAADQTALELTRENVLRASVSLGGNVYVLGEREDGKPWSVGIVNPDIKGAYLCVVDVRDKSVVTSGDYERYFEQDGVRYHHVFDPATGFPAETDLRSVSVISESSMQADGLATALFVMGYEKAMEYCRMHPEIEAVFILKSKEIRITEGLKPVFTFAGKDAGYTYAA